MEQAPALPPKTNKPMPSFTTSFTILSFCLALSVPAASAGANKLKSLLAKADAIALESDFSKAKPLEKGIWQQRQHTRWAIEDGVLRGIPSSAEYQASRSDH